jgi:hypothetical protein
LNRNDRISTRGRPASRRDESPRLDRGRRQAPEIVALPAQTRLEGPGAFRPKSFTVRKLFCRSFVDDIGKFKAKRMDKDESALNPQIARTFRKTRQSVFDALALAVSLEAERDGACFLA